MELPLNSSLHTNLEPVVGEALTVFSGIANVIVEKTIAAETTNVVVFLINFDIIIYPPKNFPLKANLSIQKLKTIER